MPRLGSKAFRMRLQKVGHLGLVRFQSLWKVTGVGSAWRTELRVHSSVGWSTPIPRDQIKWNQNIEWDRAAEPAIEAGAVRWRGAARADFGKFRRASFRLGWLG